MHIRLPSTEGSLTDPRDGLRHAIGRGRLGRPIGILLAALVVAGGSYAVSGLSRAIDDGPSTGIRPVQPPGAATGVDDAGGDLGGTADDRLPLTERRAFWAERVETRPTDFLSLVQLALVEAEAARLDGDLARYTRAAELIDRSLAILPAYPPTIRARGSIRFSLHDFAGALADARTVLDASPDDAAARALAGDASLELGDLATARADYERLATIAPGPWLDVRLARLASVSGDSGGALALARRASREAETADPGEVGFYAYAVGEYARLSGDVEAARAGFARALQLRPTDLAALLGMARVEASAGETASAIERLQRATAIAPQPEALALLSDLLAATGDTDGADRAAATVRAIGTLSSVDGAVFDRQLLHFELDHGGATETILDAARASAAARPDAGGHDLVAWALYRLGRYDEAAVAIDKARAGGADDARLRYHDGAIELARGNAAAGGDLLRSALELGPALDPIEMEEATGLLAHSG